MRFLSLVVFQLLLQPTRCVLALKENQLQPGIPANIFQSWKTKIEQIEPELQANLSRWKVLNPSWNYVFFDDADAAKFIKENFPLEVFSAYNRLRIGTFKSDLARYCYLYVHGGVWADLDVPAFSLDGVIEKHGNFDLLIAKDATANGLWQGLFYTVAKNPILFNAINSATSNVHNHFYGCSDLAITGPRMFGSVVAGYHGDNAWIVKSREEDYVLTSNGLRTVITCCAAAEGPIVGDALAPPKPKPRNAITYVEGGALVPEARRESVHGNYLNDWCCFRVYTKQTPAVIEEAKEKRPTCLHDPGSIVYECIIRQICAETDLG